MKAGLKADFELSVLKSWWWGISVRGDGNLIHLCPKGEGHSSSASHLSEYLSSDWSTDFKPNMIGWGNIGRGVDIKNQFSLKTFSVFLLSINLLDTWWHCWMLKTVNQFPLPEVMSFYPIISSSTFLSPPT